MPVFPHDELPIHAVPRIQTRVLIGSHNGATSTAVWEQWMQSDSFIPLHYHDVEEVLVILSGAVELTLEDETSVVHAPASILIEPRRVHSLRPSGTQKIHSLAIFPTSEPKIFAPDGSERPMPWKDGHTRG